MTPRERHQRADHVLDHALRLERASEDAVLAAFSTVTPSNVAATYGRLARTFARDVAEAWEIVGDAYEEAGHARASWARLQARKARKRAVELGRIRFVVESVGDSGLMIATPATLDEVVREVRDLRHWEMEWIDGSLGFEGRNEGLLVHGSPAALRRLRALLLHWGRG